MRVQVLGVAVFFPRPRFPTPQYLSGAINRKATIPILQTEFLKTEKVDGSRSAKEDAKAGPQEERAPTSFPRPRVFGPPHSGSLSVKAARLCTLTRFEYAIICY